MESNYISEVTFATKDKSLSRTILLPFRTRLDKVASLLYASMVEEEDIEEYTFLFRFGDEIYITRKEEQESGYGYSSSAYHLLEEETFFNVLFRKVNSASFELSSLKEKENLVLDMEMGPIKLNEEKKKLALLDGKGKVGKDYVIVPSSFAEIEKRAKKNLPLVRKASLYVD